jgi:hypothetical protein
MCKRVICKIEMKQFMTGQAYNGERAERFRDGIFARHLDRRSYFHEGSGGFIPPYLKDPQQQ